MGWLFLFIGLMLSGSDEASARPKGKQKPKPGPLPDVEPDVPPQPHATLAEHMAWEEQVLAPKIPAAVRAWVFQQHQQLKLRGDRPEEVAAHAKEEEARLRPHISAAEFRQLQVDHVFLLADVPEPPKPEPPPEPAPDVDVYEPVPGSEPLWMLPGNDHGVRSWSFKQRRPFGSSNPTKHHRGIDIDAEALDPVLMPEAGQVIKRQGWSGTLTRGLHVQLFSGPLLIVGALHPSKDIAKVGDVLQRGELLGRIGTYPGGSTMLHVEQWTVGAERVPWLWQKPRPAELVDPTAYLKSMER